MSVKSPVIAFLKSQTSCDPRPMLLGWILSSVAATSTATVAVLACFLVPHVSHAVPAPLWNEATWFYRSPTSAFPSGQTSRRELSKNIKNRQQEASLTIEWDQRLFKVQSEQVLRDIHLSTLARIESEGPIFSKPLAAENDRISWMREGTLVRIVPTAPGLSILSSWVQVYDGQWLGWMKISHLKPVREDFGYFRTLLDTYLRSSPQQGAPIISTAAKDTLWTATKFVDDFIEVQKNGQKLYLDINHLGHRADFSNWAYHKRHGWIRVQSRRGSMLFSAENKKYDLEDFIAFETDPFKGLMRDSLPQGPQLRSRVQIRSINSVQWLQSRIDGHGDVWWKINLNEEKKEPPTEVLSLSEVLKKDLFSISIDGHEKTSGLVSGHGVFKTQDGTHWQKIPFFREDNYPVLVHPENVWFVGSYRSTNFGKTFEPYIRWDSLTELIQNELNHPPLYLKLTKIEALKSSQIQLSIETGYKRLKLRGHILGQTWKIIRN